MANAKPARRFRPSTPTAEQSHRDNLRYAIFNAIIHARPQLSVAEATDAALQAAATLGFGKEA